MQRNRIEVAGYLVAKPVRRYLPSGTPVANTRLGETYAYKDSQGNTQKHTNWHSLSFYAELADLAVSYEKGDHLFIEGSIEQRKFTPAKDGVERTVHELIVRRCHLMAARGAPANGADAEGTTQPEIENGALDAWPVG